MPQIRSCSMSDGRQMASTASAFVVALPVVDPGSWPRPAGCLPRRVRPRRAAQRLPSRPVCPARCCSCAWLSRRKSWLDFLTFFRAGSTGHPPTSRWPAVQNFENELRFFLVSVFREICTIKQFTIFERGRNGHSSNDLFLIPQNPAPASQPRVSSLSPPRLNPHPVEPPRRLVVAGQKHPSGSSTSSLAMIPMSIVFSLTRRSRWYAGLFVSGSCRRARFVAVWSPGPTGMGPLKLVGVCARGVRH